MDDEFTAQIELPSPVGWCPAKELPERHGQRRFLIASGGLNIEQLAAWVGTPADLVLDHVSYAMCVYDVAPTVVAENFWGGDAVITLEAKA